MFWKIALQIIFILLTFITGNYNVYVFNCSVTEFFFYRNLCVEDNIFSCILIEFNISLSDCSHSCDNALILKRTAEMDPPEEPVLTESAPNSRPTSSRPGSRNSVKFPTSSKPLPPIGTKSDPNLEEDSDSDTTDSDTDSDLSGDENGKGDLNDDSRSTKSNISRGEDKILCCANEF